jgi:transposase InsO family protein
VKPNPEKDEAGTEDEMKHLEIVAESLAAGEERAGVRRGTQWQRGRRELERTVREGSVEYGSFVLIGGGTRKDAASDLGLSPRTLRDWAERSESGSLRAEMRGRPLKDSGPLKRNEVIRYLREVGPGVGVARIRGVFPEVPRCEVSDIVGQYREVYVRENMILVHELEWTRPGAVWAMDHLVPPSVIEGRYRAVLAVRDLGSGEQILWEPVESEDAREVVIALEARFRVDGEPLVMKSDNGSGFIAGETRELLSSHKVIQLLSPPVLPQYNGSVEAGNGSMRARTDWKAALRSRHGEWTREDLDAARDEANEMPGGVGVLSAGSVWRSRPAITSELRAAFRATVSRIEAEERAAYGLSPGVAAGPRLEAEIKRTSIRRALVAHGILKIRRRWIPLPKKLLKAAKIS